MTDVAYRLLRSLPDFMEDKLGSCRSALAEEDARELVELAHSAKGSALSGGARRLGSLFERIEFLGARGALAEIAPIIEALREALAEFREAVDRSAPVFAPPAATR